MPRMLLGLIVDVVAGLVITGVLAALLVATLPARPGGQIWLWGLALISIVTVGTARRCLAARGQSQRPPSST